MIITNIVAQAGEDPVTHILHYGAFFEGQTAKEDK